MTTRRVTRVTAAAALTIGGLLLAAAAPAGAAAASNDTISVSGHGSVRATPDTLVSDMDAWAHRSTAQAALDAASQVATAVVDALEANGRAGE